MSTQYYFSQDEINAAMRVSVYDYLLSGRGAYSAYSTGKIDRESGEMIYTCDYDGFKHDTVKITSKGFIHWASGKRGCYFAYDFLRDYCGYTDGTFKDKLSIIEEIYTAVYGTPSKTWDEHVMETKGYVPQHKKGITKRFKGRAATSFLTCADIATLSESELNSLKPKDVAKDTWVGATMQQRYELIVISTDEQVRSLISTLLGRKIPEAPVQDEKKLELPAKSSDNKRVFSYLNKTRGLSPEIIRWLFSKHYIYEGVVSRDDKENHALIVVGIDDQGETRYAYRRDLWDTWDEYHRDKEWSVKPFKGECKGSDKRFAWSHENHESHYVYIFETPIDAFSFMDLWAIQHPDMPFSNIITLGGVSTKALDEFLSRRQDITNAFICLDNDNDKEPEKAAGPINASRLQEYLNGKGITAEKVLAPAVIAVDLSGEPISENGEYKLTKDYNEFLRSYKASHPPNREIIEQQTLFIPRR